MRLKPVRWAMCLVLSLSLFAGYAAAGKDPVVIDVTAAFAGASAEQVERQVVIPLEVLMAGTPGLEHVRSQSLPGMAWIRLEFRATTPWDRARQEVINHLAQAPFLPSGVVPQLGVATMANQLLRYTLRGPKDAQGRDLYTPGDLRALQTLLERQLRRVPGIAAILSAGGSVKRYEVQLDPDRLHRYGVALQQVQTALAQANSNAGGDYVNQGKAAVTVRGTGLFGGGEDPLQKALDLRDPREAAAKLRAEEQRRVRELRSVVIATVNKVPVRIEDVVDGGRMTRGEELGHRGVVVGHQSRAGQVGLSRRGTPDEHDVVQGIVLLRPGDDAARTLGRLVPRIKELNQIPGHLLPGVCMEPYYQQNKGSTQAGEVLWIRGQFPVDTSLERAVEGMRQLRRLLLRYPEVGEVVSQVGRAEGTMEPLGFDHTHAVVLLRPAQERKRTRRQLAEDIETQLTKELPGVAWDLTPDFRDEMQAVFTASPDHGLLKIFGRDLEGLERLAAKAADQLSSFPGVSGVQIVHSLGRMNLDIRVDRDKCKRWGVSVADVQSTIQTALGGWCATQIVQGASTCDITLCWPGSMRGSGAALLDTPVDVAANQAPGGRKDKGPENPAVAQPRLRLRDLVSPLGDDGEPDPKGTFVREGAAAIYREEGRRFVPIRFRLQEKDALEVFADLRKKLSPLFEAPYRAEWQRLAPQKVERRK